MLVRMLFRYSKLLVLFALLGLVGCGLNPYEPRLKVSRVTLELSSVDAQGSFTVANIGETGSVLNWEASSLSPRISFNPPKGTVPEGEEQAVEVKLDRRKFSTGQFVAVDVAVTSNGGTSKVKVEFVATDDGMLACGTFPETFGATAPSEPKAPESSLPYAPNELLVQYAAPITPQSATAQASLERLAMAVTGDYGFQTLKQASYYRPALVSVPLTESVPEAIERLSADPRVAYAEPNYYIELFNHRLPSDTYLDEQWHLLNFGLPEAWELEAGENEVVIAVIDSGVDMLHEDLVDKIVPGCDFFAQDNNPSPVELGGNAAHGTHVAGIAAATGNNRLGVTGVAYGSGVKILPINIFNEFGSQAKLDDLYDALLWAAGIFPKNEGVGTNRYPADVINLSLGLSTAQPPETLQSINDVTKRLYDRGVIVVAAAGNGGLNDRVYAPATSPWVFTVGAVTSDFERAPYSNYAESSRTVDFMAPGGAGSDCGPIGIISTYPDNSYTCLAGTSMAAPFVAGVAALVLSQNPELSPGQVKARLSKSALFDGDYMSAEAYGAGIICADRALGAPTQCGR